MKTGTKAGFRDVPIDDVVIKSVKPSETRTNSEVDAEAAGREELSFPPPPYFATVIPPASISADIAPFAAGNPRVRAVGVDLVRA